MPRSILIAFIGQSIEQPEKTFQIKDGYECWDLKKFSLDEFIEALKLKIPPINNNVLRNYKSEDSPTDIWSITEKQYSECSWVLLIPDTLEDEIVNSYAEDIFLLNLYSSNFLYPAFYATDFGITRLQHKKHPMEYAHGQNQSRIFKRTEFVTFFKQLLPQSQYGTWQLNRSLRWKDEDWRLFTAAFLFSGLKKYENSKDSFGWPRESAEMAIILESLFTANDTQSEEVGYRLRKRLAALIAFHIPDIEKEIKNLYKQRSAFVHGSFFSGLAKDTKKNEGQLPLPDFNLLYKQKEYVRLALVAYLHLARLIQLKPMDYKNNETVISALEQAVIDIDLRKKITEEIEKIFALMPK